MKKTKKFKIRKDEKDEKNILKNTIIIAVILFGIGFGLKLYMDSTVEEPIIVGDSIEFYKDSCYMDMPLGDWEVRQFCIQIIEYPNGDIDYIFKTGSIRYWKSSDSWEFR